LAKTIKKTAQQHPAAGAPAIMLLMTAAACQMSPAASCHNDKASQSK
jgi:hypothetical protein